MIETARLLLRRWEARDRDPFAALNADPEVMGNPEWMQLEMFQDMFVRAQNADAMYPLIEQWTMEHSKREIMERCQAAGCPITAVFTIGEAAEHPHLHVVCASCGAVESAPPGLLDAAAERLAAELGFTLDEGHVALSGTCRACRDRAGPEPS